MTIVTWQEFAIGGFANSAQNSTIVTQGNAAVTSANHSAAFVFQAPKDGNINKILVTIGTVSGSCTIEARLETVSGTNPSGSLAGTNTNGTQAVSNNTTYAVTLTASKAVTKGDILAIVIKYSAGTTINVKTVNAYQQSKYPYGLFNTGGTYATAATPVVSPGYDDGTYAVIPPIVPAVATATTYNSGSTPDERGNYFTLPQGARATGIWIAYQNSATSADFTLKLYDSDGTSVLASVAMDADTLFGTSGGMMYVHFTSRVTLLANTAYRITVLATTANDNAWVRFQALNTAVMGAFPGGANWYGTSRTDAGAWTEVTTDWYPMGLLVDGIDSGAGIARLLGGGLLT